MDRVCVAVLATLDSKHEAARFVCDALTAAGATPWLVDLSLRPHTYEFADVNAGAIAESAGLTWTELGRLSRADAANVMMTAGTEIVRARFARREIDGAIGVGGAN